MNRVCTLLAMVVIVAAGGIASAQRPGGPGGPGGRGGAAILMIEAVQKELGITEEQKTKLRESLQGQRENFQQLQNLTGEERQKKFEEMTKKTDELVQSILDAKQKARFAELQLQREGGAALFRAEIAEKLKLTSEQKEQVAKIQSQGMSAPPANFRDLSEEDRRKAFTEMREKREKATASLLGLLTAEQKAEFEKLQGAKFEFPALTGRLPPNNN